jgi:hypothetical protein
MNQLITVDVQFEAEGFIILSINIKKSLVDKIKAITI